MSAILEERYFEWLYAHIHDPDLVRPNKTYWNLIRQLYKKEFVYIVANDDNRCADGRTLRAEFLADWEEEYETSPDWSGLPCSMLEMLIALCNRLEFQTDEPAENWFWALMKNVGLSHINDQRYDDDSYRLVDEILDRVIWRRYSYSGVGGLFPIKRASMDQRELEIWFQMHTYLLENV